MTRTIVVNLLLLALPFIIYGGWAAYVKQMKEESAGAWDEAPLTWLLIAGFALMFSGLVVTRLLEDDNPDVDFIPAHMEDGKLVPAENRPRDKDGS